MGNAIVRGSNPVPSSNPQPSYGPTITLDKGASIEWEKTVASFGVGGYQYSTQQAEKQLETDPSVKNQQYVADLYQADYYMGMSVWANANIAMKQAAPLKSQLNSVNEQLKQVNDTLALAQTTGRKNDALQLIELRASLNRQQTELNAQLKSLQSKIKNLNTDWQLLQAQENSYVASDPLLLS